MIKIYRCWYCKNFNSQEKEGMSKCKAYPNGIPLEILKEQVDHRKNIAGDNGICFEPDIEVTKSFGINIDKQN